ncbi:MAG: hypothetical protein V9H25_04855 [Candidatus Competibacter sp.]
MGGNPLRYTDPQGLSNPALLLGGPPGWIIFGGSAATICLSGGCSAIGDALKNWWDDDSYPDPYGGYTQADEDDALDLANHLTGKESCELLREAITILKERIRGRKINNADHGGGDAGHRRRVKILEDAKEKLEKALEKCC